MSEIVLITVIIEAFLIDAWVGQQVACDCPDCQLGSLAKWGF